MIFSPSIPDSLNVGNTVSLRKPLSVVPHRMGNVKTRGYPIWVASRFDWFYFMIIIKG